MRSKLFWYFVGSFLILAAAVGALIFFKARAYVLILGFAFSFLWLHIFAMLAKRKLFYFSFECLALVALVLATLETAFIILDRTPAVFLGSYATSYFRRDPNLGYTATPSDHYRSIKFESGKIVYDVNYSISDIGFRNTIGNVIGPSVVFLGDSFTFGEGLNDNAALPQVFSDFNGRKYNVLNFGFHGYGPQQSLRLLEQGLFDNKIGDHPLAFILQTMPWHVVRAACIPNYTFFGPRYELTQDGSVAYTGRCRSAFMYYLDKTIRLSPGVEVVWDYFVQRSLKDSDYDLYLGIIKQIKNVVETKYKSRFLVAYLRYEDKSYFNGNNFSNEKVIQFFKDNQIEYLDATLKKNLQWNVLDDELMLVGDAHPSASAQAKRAQLINQWFNKQPLADPKF